MRLGVDFGTTHTVAALVDRGNYPTVGFEWGDSFPSVIAVRALDGVVRYGQEAEEVAGDPGFAVIRSFKRLVQDAGPMTELPVAGRSYRVADLLTGYFSRLRDALRYSSNAEVDSDEPLEVAVSVPANATSDQRFLTLDGFRRAGFEVVTLLNEPSAAGFEYGHRFRRTVTSKREHVLVYDLGGGTFDASLIHMTGLVNEVVASAGLPRLGGDDFDEAILEVCLDRAGAPSLGDGVRAQLKELVRTQKEALLPQSRRFVIDLSSIGRPPLSLPLDEIHSVCLPLVERTLETIEEVLARGAGDGALSARDLAGLYVVGGASAYPLIGRRLREEYGQPRVKRSPHPFAATAIGLACFLDDEAGYELSDCLTRHFGVFRETQAGREVSFDPIFSRDTRLPGPKDPPLASVRRYQPAHNLGHFRFVECSNLRDGRPDGFVSPWDGITFPFDRSLRGRDDLLRVPVRRVDGPLPEIEERYECTSSGLFQVTLTCLEDGWSRSFQIARHAMAG